MRSDSKAEHRESQCRNDLHCVNCEEKHSADAKEYRLWHKEKEILRMKFTGNISFIEARKLVEAPTPVPGISYANITQSSMKKVSVIDTATQTDPINIVDTSVQSKTSTKKNKKKKRKNCRNKNYKVTPPRKVKLKHLLRKKNRGWPEKCHHGDNKKKRIGEKQTNKKTKQKKTTTKEQNKKKQQQQKERQARSHHHHHLQKTKQN